MQKGEILLRRKEKHFKAGFCVINKDYPSLIKELFILHPDEISHYESLKFDRRKASYLLGRVAAKNAISELVIEKIQSVLIEFGVFKFPVVKSIKNQNIQVSISHCGNIGVALAFPEEHPLGIDIEKIDKSKVDAVKAVICENEFKLIKSSFLSELIGSTIVWTIKESLSKVLKTGMTMDFKVLEIKSLQKEGTVYISTFKYFTQYKSLSYQVNDHICTIVLPKNTSVNFDVFSNALDNTIT